MASVVIVHASLACADVILRQVDGGPNYYSQYSKSLPSDPSYFPIGVWFESVVDSNAELDKSAGLNLYVALTANSNLSLVKSNGMRAILQQLAVLDFTVRAKSKSRPLQLR